MVAAVEWNQTTFRDQHSLADIAAARRVRLTEVRSTVTGDIDLNGILGVPVAIEVDTP